MLALPVGRVLGANMLGTSLSSPVLMLGRKGLWWLGFGMSVKRETQVD